MKIAIINGPNLNRLGTRQPSIYGSKSFDETLQELQSKYPNHTINYYQSNIEGELINALQQMEKEAEAIIFNPGAYTHTSIALGDAVAACAVPVIELHISNVQARESFRHHSYVSPHALGVISGFGLKGYELGIRALL